MSYVILHPIYLLISILLEFATFVVIAAVIVSWLVAFGVLSLRNPLARQLVQILDMLTEPLFRPVRRILPPMGGLDLSPVLVLIAIYILQVFVDDLFGYLLRI